MDNLKVVTEVDRGYRMPAPRGCPVAVHKLMLRCWEVDRRTRCTFPEVVTELQARLQELKEKGHLEIATETPAPVLGELEDYGVPQDNAFSSSNPRSAVPTPAPPKAAVRPARARTYADLDDDDAGTTAPAAAAPFDYAAVPQKSVRKITARCVLSFPLPLPLRAMRCSSVGVVRVMCVFFSGVVRCPHVVVQQGHVAR
jgi:hypothetical protein